MKTIEEKILGGVWVLLLDVVNDFLGSIDDDVPLVKRNTGGLAARRSPQGGWRIDCMKRNEGCDLVHSLVPVGV